MFVFYEVDTEIRNTSPSSFDAQDCMDEPCLPIFVYEIRTHERCTIATRDTHQAWSIKVRHSTYEAQVVSNTHSISFALPIRSRSVSICPR